MGIKIHVKQKNESVFSTDTNWDSNEDLASTLPQLIKQFPPEKGFNISVTSEVYGTFLVNLPRLLNAIKHNNIDNYLAKLEKREELAIAIADVIFQKFDKDEL